LTYKFETPVFALVCVIFYTKWCSDCEVLQPNNTWYIWIWSRVLILRNLQVKVRFFVFIISKNIFCCAIIFKTFPYGCLSCRRYGSCFYKI